jgi:glycosyltransferase involved in cell wall biosynthesis
VLSSPIGEEGGTALASRPILFIERSPGLSGSSISLGHILAHIDRHRYEPYAALSQPEQREYVQRHVHPAVETRTLTPRRSLKSRWIGRAGLRGARACRAERPLHWLMSVADVGAVEAEYLCRLYAFARDRRVVGIHQNNGFDVAAVILARLLRVPIVAYQRGAEWDSFLVRRLVRWVDLYLANSLATRDCLVALGVPVERIVVLYPPVALPAHDFRAEAAALRREFGISTSAPCFGILGKLVPWKGQAVFLRAAQRVLQAVPGARALVVGDVQGSPAAYRAELRALARELGIADRVVFTGFRADVPAVLALLDVVAHASVRPEPFGRVIVEAMAMAKPVVATRAGGPVEILTEGETGFLIPPDDPELLANRLIQLLGDAQLRGKIGEAARRKVSVCFSIERHMRTLHEVYGSTFGGGRRAAPAGRHAVPGGAETETSG